MDVDDLVNATASIHLVFHCCNSCCKPTFFYLPDDPSEDVLSASSKRKFYVVKKGAPNGEGIYSHWDLARVQVEGMSSAEHKSCATADLAWEMWAAYCHEHHPHSSDCRLAGSGPHPAPACPPPTPAAQPGPTTPASRPAARSTGRRARPPYQPTADSAAATPPTTTKFYRVSGSPRVLIHVGAAEAELRTSGASSLLVGRSLQEVEDDDEVTWGDTQYFYRVFGSPRVLNSCDRAVAELVATQAAGLLVGTSLDDVDDM
ncbi:hypothetical protein B0H13DRAFT_2326931 [Mycena leptocephala]|nr:hypothetical protein B0H13DRAFT_2326931 [Mycena leptocephala]